jgi:hypothetical protein
MTVSTPVESVIARRKLLLSDIRDVFAGKGGAPIPLGGVGQGAGCHRGSIMGPAHSD